MSLVRVMTRLPEYPAKLVRDLRSHGFEVETCVTKDAAQHPADLEITVDYCSPDGVSEAISGVGHDRDLYVVMTPETRKAKVRSIGMVVIGNEGEGARILMPKQLTEICEALLGKPEVAANGRVIDWTIWTDVKRLGLCVYDVFSEISGETLQLGRQLWAASMDWVQSRRQKPVNHEASEIDEQLVPTMFALSSDRLEEPEPIVETSPHAMAPKKFGKEIFAILRQQRRGALAPMAIMAILVFGVFLFGHSPHSRTVADRPLTGQQGNAVSSDQQIQKAAEPNALQTPRLKPGPVVAATMIRSGNVTQQRKNDIEYFAEDVTVRHFATPNLGSQQPGIKRRIVVD
jgi:hypothetical protein